MLIVEEGKEQEEFLAFVEKAVSKLAEMDYAGFIDAFDESRLAEENLLLGLRYLDERREVVKIDNPLQCKCEDRSVDFYTYRNGKGYAMDYDLTTDGQPNDLTLQVSFVKAEKGYISSLDDLHTL